MKMAGLHNFIIVVVICLSQTSRGARNSCPIGNSCVSLRQCPLILQELQQGRKARSEGNSLLLSSIVDGIKGLLCDEDKKTVCCPIYMGSFIREKTQKVNNVYAIDDVTIRLLDFPEAASLGADVEVYFWKDPNCLPGKEYDVLPESFSMGYKGDAHYKDFQLPPSLTLDSVRCMSLWIKDDMMGYVHLSLNR